MLSRCCREAGLGHWYLRDVRRVGEADEVAEQRGTIAEHEVQPQERRRTCRGGHRKDSRVAADTEMARRDPVSVC